MTIEESLRDETSVNPEWENNIYRLKQQVNRYPFDIVVSFMSRNFGHLDAAQRADIKVLEIGCGTGNNVWYLAREGYDVSAIEGSQTAVRLGQAMLGKEGLEARIEVGDFAQLSWPDNTFDAVIDRCAVTHNRLEHIKRSLNEIKRVLKPQGVFLSQMFSAHDTCRFDGRELGDGAFTEFDTGPFKNMGVAYFANRNDLKHLMESRFKVVSLGLHLIKDETEGEERAFWHIECENVGDDILAEKIARGLILCGTYRSGTTLLQKMVDAHPQCEVVMQPCLPFFKTLQGLKMGGGFTDIGEQPLGIGEDEAATGASEGYFDAAFDADRIDALVSGIGEALSGHRKEGDDVPAAAFVESLRRELQPGSAVSVLSDITDAVQEYRSSTACRYSGFKELYIDEYLEGIIRLSPRDFRILHLIRDPRAIVASRNFGAYRNEGDAPTDHPLLLIIKMWRTSVRCRTDLAKRFPRAFLPLKYEDLVRDRAQTARDICDFLALDDYSAMLDDASLRSENGTGWRPNTSFGDDHDPSKLLDKWNELLPQETIGAVEFLCRKEMAAMGYPCTLSESEQMACFDAYREDVTTLLPWTRIPGLLLDDVEKSREIARNSGNEA